MIDVATAVLMTIAGSCAGFVFAGLLHMAREYQDDKRNLRF